MRYLRVAARSIAAFARGLAYAVLCLTVLAVLAIVLVPRLSGVRFGTVLSDSMRPGMTTGDMIIVRSVEPAQIEVGDVILFRSAADPGARVAHRVVEIVDSGGTPAFVTKGDANQVADRSPVPAARVLGEVQFHLPLLGYLTREMNEPLVFLLALAVPGAFVIASEAWNIVGALRRERQARLTAQEGDSP